MSKKGFTLMELMVAIAVIAILSAIATPNAISWLRTARFNSAVRNVKATVDSMRMYAVKNNSQADVTFNNGTNTYQTDKWERTTNTHERQNYNLAQSVTVSYDNNPLRYNARGMADNPGTLTIQGPGGLCLTVLISAAGSARIEACP